LQFLNKRFLRLTIWFVIVRIAYITLPPFQFLVLLFWSHHTAAPSCQCLFETIHFDFVFRLIGYLDLFFHFIHAIIRITLRRLHRFFWLLVHGLRVSSAWVYYLFRLIFVFYEFLFYFLLQALDWLVFYRVFRPVWIK
jgi:hypothetical protein